MSCVVSTISIAETKDEIDLVFWLSSVSWFSGKQEGRLQRVGFVVATSGASLPVRVTETVVCSPARSLNAPTFLAAAN